MTTTHTGDTLRGEASPLGGLKATAGVLLRRYWAEVLVIILAFALWAPRLSGPLDLRWDAGVYYILGTSLAEGHGYRILSEPGAPEAIQYPPLLPAFVALHEKILGTADPALVAPWLRRSYLIISLGFGLSLLALARRFLSNGLALIASALCLCQLMTIFISDLLFTELPFALISVLFVLAAANPTLKSRPWLRESLTFVLAAAGFFLRTAGVALLGAWVLHAFLRRQWRVGLGRGAIALLPVLAWQMHVGEVRASREYAHPAYEYQRAPYQYYNVSYAENIALIDPFRPELGRVRPATLLERMFTNLFPMFQAVGETVSTKKDLWTQSLERSQHRILGTQLLPKEVMIVPILIYSTIALFGLVLLIRRGRWLLALVVLLSLGLAGTTPWPAQFSRYLMPTGPFLAVCAVVGWAELRSSLSGNKPVFVAGRGLLIVFLLLAFVMQAYAGLNAFRSRQAVLPTFASGIPNDPAARLFYHDGSWVSWEKAVEWIKANAAPDAIVATSAPHFLYLLTGRQAVLPPMEADPARAAKLLGAVPVSYVITDKLKFVDISRRYALPAMENQPADWQLVYAMGGTKIFQRTTKP
jgi:hypothetical protein